MLWKGVILETSPGPSQGNSQTSMVMAKSISTGRERPGRKQKAPTPPGTGVGAGGASTGPRSGCSHLAGSHSQVIEPEGAKAGRDDGIVARLFADLFFAEPSEWEYPPRRFSLHGVSNSEAHSLLPPPNAIPALSGEEKQGDQD